MQFFGQLKKAILERLAASFSQGDQGRIGFNTTSKRAILDDDTAVTEFTVKNTLIADLIDEMPTTVAQDQKVPELNPALNDFVWGNGVISDTKAGIDARARTAKLIYYATDINKYFGDDGTNLIDLGGGSGGVDIFHIEDFEITDAADLTSGDNATLLGGGTISGTLADEAVTQLAGNESLKYTQAAGSLNDYFLSPVIDVDLRDRGNDIGMSFYSMYDGLDNDIQVGLYDVTNTTIISSNLDFVKASSDARKHFVSAFLPSSATQVRWFFHVKALSNGAVLKVDDIEIKTNPVNYNNLMDFQYIHQNTSNGYGGAGASRIGRMTNTDTNTGANLITITDDATDGTQYTANRRCLVIASASHNYSTAGRMGFSLNSNQLTTNIESITAQHRINLNHEQNATNASATMTAPIVMEAGDVLRRHGDASADGTAGRAVVVIAAQAIAEHVITPAKSNISAWEEYSPTVVGFGTPAAASNYWHRQDGPDVLLMVFIDPGTPTATEAQVPLPPGLSILAALNGLTTIGSGDVHNSVTGVNVLGTGGDTFVNLCRHDLNSALVAQDGNAIVGSTDNLAFFARIPCEEYKNSSNVSFLAAVPVAKVAYLKDIKSAGTNGGTFTLGAWRIRDLNTLSGDEEVMSADGTNEFTLGPGQYDIEFSSPGNNVGVHQARLRNITDGVTAIPGTPVTMNGGEINTIRSIGMDRITLTKTTDFRIEHQSQLTQVTTGFGGAGNYGEDETYAQVKVTKLR